MARDTEQIALTEDDAWHAIVGYARGELKSRHPDYGYDIYLPNVMTAYFCDRQGLSEQDAYQPLHAASPYFYAAAWELCRRGILRPGITSYNTQSTEDGSAGNGYSITPFGRQWLEESDKDDYIPTEPGRFAQMLEQVGLQFGDGYRERAQEAIRCYGAHAYLACCAMCGAAAESVLLALAIAKSGDDQRILKDYAAANGRSHVERYLLGQMNAGLRNEFTGYLGLLKYWRDAASHGQVQGIADNEAFTSLALLLRLSKCASDNWAKLVGSS